MASNKSLVDIVPEEQLDTDLPLCRGRIYGENGKLKKTQKIDGARLCHFESDPQTGKESVVLKIDDSEIPEFWLEVTIPVDLFEKLVKWEREYKKELDEKDKKDSTH